MDKSSVEAELCRLVDQFNDRIISHRDFCRIFLALKALKYKNTYLKNKNGGLFLSVDSLIRLDNIITGLRYIGSTLFRMGIFGAAHAWWGGDKKPPPVLKICHTYPTMMNLGTVIPYIKNILKIYESRDIPPDFY